MIRFMPACWLLLIDQPQEPAGSGLFATGFSLPHPYAFQSKILEMLFLTKSHTRIKLSREKSSALVMSFKATTRFHVCF